MATLLHFLRSGAIALLLGFMLSLSGLVGWLSGLTILKGSVMSAIAQPLHQWTRTFLIKFGGGDCVEGTLAIALTIGVVAALWNGFKTYKCWQRDRWRLVGARRFNL